MNFELIINPNVVLGIRDKMDTLVSEALYSTYESFDDRLIIKWNGFIDELNYKLDVSDCFNDIMSMLNSVKERRKQFKMEFPSQSFFELWKCNIDGDMISLEWVGLNEKYNINSNNEISLDINLYVEQWLKLLVQLRANLETVGYNKNNLEDFYLLDNLDRFLVR